MPLQPFRPCGSRHDIVKILLGAPLSGIGRCPLGDLGNADTNECLTNQGNNQMDNLTKTLLTGAAISALAAVPAMAGVHLAVSQGHNGLVLAGSTHYKSNFAPKKATNVTETVTFTYTGHESTMYHKAVLLGHPNGWITETAGMPGVCQTIPGQKAKSSKDNHAKVKAHVSSVHVTVASTTGGFPGCTGTVLQYQPNYTLKDKKAKQDMLVFTISKRKWTTSAGKLFNLKLNENWTVNID